MLRRYGVETVVKERSSILRERQTARREQQQTASLCASEVRCSAESVGAKMRRVNGWAEEKGRGRE